MDEAFVEVCGYASYGFESVDDGFIAYMSSHFRVTKLVASSA